VGILSGGVIARDLDLNEIINTEKDEVEVTAVNLNANSLTLPRAGIEQVVNNDQLTILRCKGDDNLQPLLTEIQRGGGKVIEVKPLRMDLEGIFISEISGRANNRTELEKKKSDEMAFSK
jgi:hypothetical protein